MVKYVLSLVCLGLLPGALFASLATEGDVPDKVLAKLRACPPITDWAGLSAPREEDAPAKILVPAHIQRRPASNPDAQEGRWVHLKERPPASGK